MKQELINEIEAEFADLQAGLFNVKAAILRMDNLEEKALEAGADPEKVALLKADWEQLRIRFKKLNEAKAAFHARLHKEFLDGGEVVVFTGT